MPTLKISIGESYGLISQKLMRDNSISAKAKAIYAYLCSFAGSSEERSAFPGVSLMIHELDICKTAFYKHRDELEKAGYITITKDRAKGKFDKCTYHICDGLILDQEQEQEQDSPFPKNQDMEDPQPCPKNQDMAEEPPCPKKRYTVNWTTKSISFKINNNNKDDIDDDLTRTRESINSEIFDTYKKRITEEQFKTILKRKRISEYAGKDYRKYLSTSVDNEIITLAEKQAARKQIESARKQVAAATQPNTKIKAVKTQSYQRPVIALPVSVETYDGPSEEEYEEMLRMAAEMRDSKTDVQLRNVV